MTKRVWNNSSGFAFIYLLLVIFLLTIFGLVYYYLFKPTDIEVKFTEEEPRKFNIDTPTPLDTESQETIITPSENGITTTPTVVQSAYRKVTLKINSYGDVDLGSGFTARLDSAWKISNKIYTHVVLKNNDSILIRVINNEFTLRCKGFIAKTRISPETVSVKPGESNDIEIIFDILPNSPFTLSYDNPSSHFSDELGLIYLE